jgi:hypothetical protein
MSGFNEQNQLTANIYTRDTSWSTVNAFSETIFKYIGMSGKILKCDGGAIWIKRGVPFSQSMGDPSDSLIKRKYINITAEFLTAY